MIKLEHLNKYYNKNSRNEYHVINDISYEFNDTGLYSFFGPSGCGKTTLLNVIGCLDNFDSGRIVLDEYLIDKYRPKKADDIRNNIIGYIFQNYNLIENKNVFENVEVVLDMVGITDKTEKKNRIYSCLKAVGLYKHRKKDVLALSGGERQRVAIARALAKNPKIILADEPTGNLDSNNTFEVMNIIKKISKDKLVILVSHERNLVNFYSDYIIELRDGEIVNEIVNTNGGELNHYDNRNIYLKDYTKEELKNELTNINIYKKDTVSNVNIEIIYKNGEVYIKPSSSSKIHLIDDSSEIKLLDMSEEEYKKEKEKVESDFTFDNFSNIEPSSKKKRYISLFTSIKNSFKKTGYIKKNKFMNFALIISGIVFAILFSALSNILTVDKSEYVTTPLNSAYVELSLKDKKNGYSARTVISDAKKVDGYICYGVPTGSQGSASIYVSLRKFYQTKYSIYESDVCLVIDEKHIDVNYGNKLENDNEVIITSWIADEILENNESIKNGIDSYEDLLNNGIDFFENYKYEDRFSSNYIIKGIVNENTRTVYMTENTYNDIQELCFNNYEIEKVYIVTDNVELMVKTLKEKYSSVIDANEGAKFRAFKNKLKDNKTSLIVLLVMSVAIFIYMSLAIRSSMFNKIKEIGTLRSIGATKKDINHIFLGDSIALTTRKSIIAYSIMFLVIAYFGVQFDASSFGIKLFNASLATYFIGVVFIYLLNILSTIIPVALLMYKTPVEIIKKYDI